MSQQLAKHHFTAEQYERMGELGVLPANKNYELIEGEIIEMSPIGSRHLAGVNTLNELLSQLLGGRVIVSVQNPILLDDYSEPQSDIALLRRRVDSYRDSLPTPADVLLVIEVADATLDTDRRMKLPLYAHAGVPEVVILNLRDEQLEHHTEPRDGIYRVTRIFKRGEHFASSTVPGIAFDVSAVLG